MSGVKEKADKPTLVAGPFPEDEEITKHVKNRLAMTFCYFGADGDAVQTWDVFTWRESRFGGHESVVLGLPARGFVTVELTFEDFNDLNPFTYGSASTSKKISLDSKFIGSGNEETIEKFVLKGRVKASTDRLLNAAMNVIRKCPPYIYGVDTCQDFATAYLKALGIVKGSTSSFEEAVNRVQFLLDSSQRSSGHGRVTDRDLPLTWIGYAITALAFGCFGSMMLLLIGEPAVGWLTYLPVPVLSGLALVALVIGVSVYGIVIPYIQVAGRVLMSIWHRRSPTFRTPLLKECDRFLTQAYRFVNICTGICVGGTVLISGTIMVLRWSNFLHPKYVILPSTALAFWKWPWLGVIYIVISGLFLFGLGAMDGLPDLMKSVEKATNSAQDFRFLVLFWSVANTVLATMQVIQWCNIFTVATLRLANHEMRFHGYVFSLLTIPLEVFLWLHHQTAFQYSAFSIVSKIVDLFVIFENSLAQRLLKSAFPTRMNMLMYNSNQSASENILLGERSTQSLELTHVRIFLIMYLFVSSSSAWEFGSVILIIVLSLPFAVALSCAIPHFLFFLTPLLAEIAVVCSATNHVTKLATIALVYVVVRVKHTEVDWFLAYLFPARGQQEQHTD